MCSNRLGQYFTQFWNRFASVRLRTILRGQFYLEQKNSRILLLTSALYKGLEVKLIILPKEGTKVFTKISLKNKEAELSIFSLEMDISQ